MRIRWKRVLLLAVATGLLLLVLRGVLLARRAPPSEAEKRPDVSISVYDHREEQLMTMPLEAYITGVTAAEMPISFPLEARKAQAVAARTYTIHHALHGGCRSQNADVCTSSACCQAYRSDEQLRENWGDDYETHIASARRATSETAGEVLLYDGEPIEALYHSASGGQTENVEDVYGNPLPYLRAVMSTAEAGTPRLTGQKTLSRAAFCEKVNARFPEAKLTKKRLEQQVEILETTDSGRVKRIKLGGATATGRQMRSLLSLDSALFTISFSKDEVTFATKGVGHGVGLSQTGANVMAMGGADYRAILTYYYTDVAIGRMERK